MRVGGDRGNLRLCAKKPRIPAESVLEPQFCGDSAYSSRPSLEAIIAEPRGVRSRTSGPAARAGLRLVARMMSPRASALARGAGRAPVTERPYKGSRSTARDRARSAAALSPRDDLAPGTPPAESALETWRPIGLLREAGVFKVRSAETVL